LKNILFRQIVIGSEVFSGAWGLKFEEKKINRILKFAYDKGIREIDTAPIYGKNNHDVEKKIGNVIKKANLKYKINTKFSINKLLINNKTELEKNLKSQLENSLKSLKKDSIDNYFFHSGTNEEFMIDDAWNFLNKKKEEGLIKNLCISMRHDLVKKNSLKQLDYLEKYGIDKISTVCNLYSKESLKKVVPLCKKKNIFIYGRMPLAKGLLTGKYTSLSAFDRFDPRSKDLKLTKKIIDFSKKIKNLSAKKSVMWSLKHCDKVILGFKNIEQIQNLND
tara:strand:- start:1156 stop:1989 length:834 start_codon:yes stop_codon:yes gene_type:complete